MGNGAVEARRVARPWIGPLARIGLSTKGVVYLLIGGLAVLAAAGQGGKVSDSHGAVKTIGEQPFGDSLLIVVAIGFAMYAVWRFLQAALDLDRKGGIKGAGKRLAYAASAVIYGALAVTAFQLSRGEDDGGQKPSTWVAEVLSKPFGDLVIGAFGVGIFVYGVVHIWHAITAHFRKKLDLSPLGPRGRALVIWVGRIGTAARGVVFGIVGYHLVLAAIHSSPGETRNVGGALRSLASKPYGEVLLGVTAGGLVLYGAFMLVRARYGRIPGSTDGS